MNIYNGLTFILEYVFILFPLRRGIYIFFASLVSCPGCIRGPLITSPSPSSPARAQSTQTEYILIFCESTQKKSAGTGSGNKKQLLCPMSISHQTHSIFLQLVKIIRLNFNKKPSCSGFVTFRSCHAALTQLFR